MGKFFNLLLSLLLLGTITLGAAAWSQAADSVNVYVTIADGSGDIAIARGEVTVTDSDGDGAFTISDALYCAHQRYYEGGAAAGFATGENEIGIFITKLWGAEEGSSYGYYVNNKTAQSMADTVKDNDYISAFVYTDLTAWSDAYSYFEPGTVSAAAGDAVTVTLYTIGYDANWAPVTAPCAGAAVTVDGIDTGVVTDENGLAVIAIENKGSHVISAKSESAILVPPVCLAEISGSGSIVLWVVIAALIIAAVAVLIIIRKRNCK